MINKNLKDYSRLFVFGCSFTSYIFPTWADILHKSMNKNVEFYNLGRAGAGNMFIANRVTEANRKFKFNSNDLVVIMWSTFCRFDFYRTPTGWVTPGNIFTQNMLSRSTTREIADLNWFMMRDLSVIDLTHSYLKTLNCDSAEFLSCPFDFESDNNAAMEEGIEFPHHIISLYSELEKEYPESLYASRGRKWSQLVKYYDPNHGDFTDYHPAPIDYYNYLTKIGFTLDQESLDYATESTEYLLQPKLHKDDIINHFVDCDKNISASYKLLW